MARSRDLAIQPITLVVRREEQKGILAAGRRRAGRRFLTVLAAITVVVPTACPWRRAGRGNAGDATIGGFDPALKTGPTGLQDPAVQPESSR